MKKTLIYVAIISVIVSGLVTYILGGKAQKKSGAVGSYVRLGEVCYGQDTDVTLACWGGFAGTLRAANNVGQASWQNITGRPVYVQLEFDYVGSASSTFWIYAATSTTATIGPYQIPANPFISVLASTGTPTFAFSTLIQASQATTSQNQNINGVAPLGYPTSTLAVSAKQYLQKGQPVGGFALGGQGLVFVRPLEYIVVQIIDQGTLQSGPCNATKNINAGLCENATSTARGFDINYRGLYGWTSTTTSP